jgi:hypothetical protein
MKEIRISVPTHGPTGPYLQEAQLKPDEGLQVLQAESPFKAFEAKVENSLMVLSDPHLGQMTFSSDEEVNSSNLSPQLVQLNSYNGISSHSESTRRPHPPADLI